MFGRHRWTAVFAAVFIIGAVEALADSVLDPMLRFPYKTAAVVVVVAAIGGAAAWLTFRLIDRLTADLVERNAALESTNTALRSLYDVSLAVAGQADPEETWCSIVEHARILLHADAALLLLETPGGELRVGAVSPEDALRSDEPREGLTSATRFLRPGLVVALQTPVQRGDERVGTLAVGTQQLRTYSVRERETLTALATLAGITIEAGRLQERVRELAVQGERERIAREMHDGLAQVLGYVNTKSQAVEQLLAERRVEEARQQVDQLAAAARSVYVDVREAILTLSDPIPAGTSLRTALEWYAADYAESSKLAVRCEFDAHAAPTITQAQQTELFRIVREAMTNVRKHAAAGRVTIGLHRDGSELVASVADDGRGFDPERAASGPEDWPHFGLAGMRERAASVGAHVVWRSAAGEGTTVEVRLPLPDDAWPSAEAGPAHATTAPMGGTGWHAAGDGATSRR